MLVVGEKEPKVANDDEMDQKNNRFVVALRAYRARLRLGLEEGGA